MWQNNNESNTDIEKSEDGKRQAFAFLLMCLIRSCVHVD